MTPSLRSKKLVADPAARDTIESVPPVAPVIQLVEDFDPSACARAHLICRGKEHRPTKCVANALSILTLDDRWRGVIAYDAFMETPILVRQPPQRDHDAVTVKPGAAWSSQDSTRAAAWIDLEYGVSLASAMVTEAMMAVAQQRTVHPVRAYLDGLRWDGVQRVELFFAHYCKSIESPYSRGVARMMFISAVARVRCPGTKVDTIAILEGPQGVGKSRLLSALASPWCADTPLSLGDKDSFQQLRGVWLYEIAELASFKGRDATRIKSFASSPSDHYRPSYEPRARSVPRQLIFVGTTNEREYLSDATGARRFWPQRIERVDLDAVKRDRDQLWAEADMLFGAGVTWWPDASLESLGADVQEDRYEGDPWHEPLITWLRDPGTAATTDGVTMSEVLAYGIGVAIERQSKNDQERATKILRRVGWHRGPQRRENGIRVRRWYPGDAVVTGAGDGGGDA